MITINIQEEAATYSDMVDLLRRIADMIEKEGYTSGYYPHWELSGEEETEEN